MISYHRHAIQCDAKLQRHGWQIFTHLAQIVRQRRERLKKIKCLWLHRSLWHMLYHLLPRMSYAAVLLRSTSKLKTITTSSKRPGAISASTAIVTTSHTPKPVMTSRGIHGGNIIYRHLKRRQQILSQKLVGIHLHFAMWLHFLRVGRSMLPHTRAVRPSFERHGRKCLVCAFPLGTFIPW